MILDKPKYKHGDKVYLLSGGEISKEKIIGVVHFEGTYSETEDILLITYTYSLSGCIGGTRFNQRRLFSTLKEAQKELLKSAMIS